MGSLGRSEEALDRSREVQAIRRLRARARARRRAPSMASLWVAVATRLATSQVLDGTRKGA